MSGRKRKKRSPAGGQSWWELPWLTGLVLLVLAAYLGLSLAGTEARWWEAPTAWNWTGLLSLSNPGGPVGAVLALVLRTFFGVVWAWLVPALLLIAGLEAFADRRRVVRTLLLRLVPLWLVTVAWLGQPDLPLEASQAARFAGLVGFHAARGAQSLVGVWGARLFLGLALLIVMILTLRPWLGWLGRPARASLAAAGRGLMLILRLMINGLRELGGLVLGLLVRLRRAVSRNMGDAQRRRSGEDAPLDLDGAASSSGNAGRHGAVAALPGQAASQDSAAAASRARRVHWPDEGDQQTLVEPDSGTSTDPELEARLVPLPSGPVELPSLDLLTESSAAVPELSPQELDAAADKLEETLRSFGVEGEVKDVRPGPVVTTYEYQPAAGIRVNQIVQRANDLALAMRARSLRMEAPIPGKAAVGIEIPNSTAQLVNLRDVLAQEQGKARRPLTVVLGRDVVGQPVSVDLAAQPHLLVAGSTGSGKSVCLNTMIANLLLYNDPARVRLLLIDPKMLEMSVYNGIPHLLLPVVTDPREALRAMNWMCAQMDLRYRQLAKHTVRNIEQYNEKVARGEVLTSDGEPVTEPMAYYVTIVDELADLMVQLGQDFELPVTRLAQKARAVGLHLVLATQRPSVDVLTGVIKANIPCRIAFRVIQRNDSRTILDQNGAEQLLGNGDMLYLMPGRAQPVRVHGAYVDVDDCEALAAHWRGYADVAQTISLTAGADGGTGVHTGEDELFDDAVRVIVTHQSGSTSLLQRRLRIGYTRAGRLMDMMEEAGIVGPFTGSKARDVLVKPADLPELFSDEAAE